MTVIYTAAAIAVLLVTAAIVSSLFAVQRSSREVKQLDLRHAVGERTP